MNKIYNILETKHKKKIILLLFFMSISTILEVVGIGSIIPAVSIILNDNIFYDYINKFIDIDKRTFVIIFFISILVFFLLKTSFMFFYVFYQANFGFEIETDFSKKLLKKYLNEDYIFFTKTNSSFLIRNVIYEVEKFRTVIMHNVYLFTDGFIFIGIMGLLLFVDFFVTITLFSSIIIIFILFYLLTKNKINYYSKRRQFFDGQRLKFLQESIAGIKELKIYDKLKFFASRFEEAHKGSVFAARFQSILSAIPRLSIELIAVSSLMIFFTMIILFDRNYEETITLMFIFGASAFRLLPLTNKMIVSLQSIRYHRPVINLISNELNKETFKDSDKKIDKLKDLPFNKAIIFKNINFKYNKIQNNILNNINLKISKYESVGLLGLTGAGKTTFLNILLGMIKPTEGTLYCDEYDIYSNIKLWQKKISYVSQSPFFLDSSIYENIAMGLNFNEIDIKKVEKVAELASIKDFINSLPEKFNTIIGEKGVRLSGGQKQRIQIARALYRNPEILIFDEATNALDKNTEKQLLKTIFNFKNKFTIFIVSHDSNVLDFCSTIVRIEEGRLTKIK